MEESNHANVDKNLPPFQLGMSSFNTAERAQFGESVRLAMACVEGAPAPIKGNALPQDESSIRQRLKLLSQEMSSQHADLLELLVRFDDQQGWKSSGANYCAAWMNFEIGISTKLSWEYLRVGRRLQSLPTLQALFRVGKLSWSKVRLITRVANHDNEKTLCHAALDASVSDVKRLCEGYRWCEDDSSDGEHARVIQQWESRSFTWNEASNGSTRIQLVLPPELAQAFLNSVEHSLNELGMSEHTMPQRRADAAVLMAESSLQNAGKAIATADRYQVSVSVDASELVAINTNEFVRFKDSGSVANKNTTIPAKRPVINGVGPIALETAKRIACDCSLSVNKTSNGEPLDIGRKSRIWPSAMARTIKERDQRCVWPGCDHSRYLHIHHIQHWADGGVTSVDNGVCLCSYHHTLVHEGGYTIEHVAHDSHGAHKQFFQQLHHHDINQFYFEESLRNDRQSFETVRQLSPTRFRFRIMNANGLDVTDQSISSNHSVHIDPSSSTSTDSDNSARNNTGNSGHSNASDSTRVDLNNSARTNTNQCSHSSASHSTRIDSDNPFNKMKCKEPAPPDYRINGKNARTNASCAI